MPELKKFTLLLGDPEWGRDSVRPLLQKWDRQGQKYLHFVFSEADYKFPLQTEVINQLKALEGEWREPSVFFGLPLLVEFRDLEAIPMKAKAKKPPTKMGSFTNDNLAVKSPAASATAELLVEKNFHGYLQALLLNCPEHFTVFFLAAETRTNKLAAVWPEWLEKYQGQCKVFETNIKTVLGWAEKKAESYGLTFDSNALETLVLAKNLVLSEINQTLEKLRYQVFLGEKSGGAELAWASSKGQTTDIFKLTEAILQKNYSLGLKILQTTLEKGPDELLKTFGLLASKWRRFHRLKLLQQQGFGSNQAAAELGQPAWLIEKDWRSAQKLSLEAWENLVILFAEEDLPIKYLKEGEQIFLSVVFRCFEPSVAHSTKKNSWLPL